MNWNCETASRHSPRRKNATGRGGAMSETETQGDMECKELEKQYEIERIKQEMVNEEIEQLEQLQRTIEILSKLLPIAMVGFIVVIVLTVIATILTMV